MIRTDRLVLRDFRPSDLVAYCQLRSHADFQRFYPARDVSPERSAELLGEFLAWAAETPRLRYQLAIEEPRIGLLGSCVVRIMDADLRQASFGCELGREHWGHGYAAEAARALLGFGFSELGAHRIHAEALAENLSALSRWFRGRWWDTVTLAVLSSEWRG